MLEGVYEVKSQIYHCIVGFPTGEVAKGEVLGEDVALWGAVITDVSSMWCKLHGRSCLPQSVCMQGSLSEELAQSPELLLVPNLPYLLIAMHEE